MFEQSAWLHIFGDAFGLLSKLERMIKMDLSTALENVKNYTSHLYSEEILCIREHKEDAIPVLLERVKYVADVGEDLPIDYEGYEYAIFLLAEFRVSEAFQYFYKFLSFDEDFLSEIIDYLMIVDFGRILGSCATAAHIPDLKSVVENEELGCMARYSAMTALFTLWIEQVISRDEIVEFLDGLINRDTDEEFLAFIVEDCAKFEIVELYDEIRKLYDEGALSDPYTASSPFIGSRIFNKQEKGEKNLDSLPKPSNRGYITDTIETIGKWVRLIEVDWGKEDLAESWGEDDPEESEQYSKFESINKQTQLEVAKSEITITDSQETWRRPEPKIGRNDPCPCGSGKKYKKCCMK